MTISASYEPRESQKAKLLSKTSGSSFKTSVLGMCVSMSVIACGSGGASSASEPKEHVRAYVEQALTFIESTSFNVATNADLDWDQVEKAALKKTAEAERIEETYPIITEVLQETSGDHSFFLTPEEFASERTGEPELPTVTLAGAGIASLTLPAFNETAGGLVTEYADTALERVAAASGKASCGWIIDLRDNNGGNMLPMLVAAAPFLPDGHVMSFSDGAGDEAEITLADVSVFHEGKRLLRSTSTVPELSNQPLAVLQSGDTASSAEATLISLKSRQDVRTFGAPSAGYATGNISKTMPDGAILTVTQSQMLSPDGTSHPGPIAPDEFADEAQQAAIDWLARTCMG